jgi:hypothetical protein
LGQRLLRLRQLDGPADWRLVDAKRLKLAFFCARRVAQIWMGLQSGFDLDVTSDELAERKIERACVNAWV